MLTAKGGELVRTNGVPGSEPHKRTDLFAVNLIRQSHDGDRGDRRVGRKDLLNLSWVDIFTAANNHFLDPAFDREIAPSIHAAEIARVKPAFRVDRAPGCIRHLKVTGHDEIAANAN